MRVIIIMTMLLLFAGCKTVEYKYIPIREVRTEEVIVRDTVIDVRLVPYFDSVSVQDTVSYLENPYAYSRAAYSLGRLNHTLATKNVKIPAEIQYREKLIRDSIPYPVEITHTVIQKEKGFLWWSGVALYALLLLTVLCKLSRLF